MNFDGVWYGGQITQQDQRNAKHYHVIFDDKEVYDDVELEEMRHADGGTSTVTGDGTVGASDSGEDHPPATATAATGTSTASRTAEPTPWNAHQHLPEDTVIVVINRLTQERHTGTIQGFIAAKQQ